MSEPEEVGSSPTPKSNYKKENMSNTILIFTDVHKTKVRIRADTISCYWDVGAYTQLTCENGDIFNLNCTEKDIDAVLSEVYYMIKEVPSSLQE